jgi:Tfp pilus assembly protein PilW
MSTRDRALGDEDGFTLVELMVTMTLAIVVLLAILGASEVFTKSATVANSATSAQDAARSTVRSMVTTLRQGLPVGSPTRSDLVVSTYVLSATDARPGDVPGWVRYCAATTGSLSSLVVGVRTGASYLPPGTCSAGDTTNGWSHSVLLNGTLQDPTRLFDFVTSLCTGGACALPAAGAIQSIGVRVAVGSTPGGPATFNSTVRDAVSFRNRSSS